MATASSPSSFGVIFDKALEAYKEKAKEDLTVHPLAAQLQSCDSPAALLTILQDQIDQFSQSRSDDERLKKWLNPTINVLYAFSATLGGGIGSVNITHQSVCAGSCLDIYWQAFSPANVIFTGVGVLLLVSVSFVSAAVQPLSHRVFLGG